jgi:hypothetical protein
MRRVLQSTSEAGGVVRMAQGPHAPRRRGGGHAWVGEDSLSSRRAVDWRSATYGYTTLIR